MLCVFQVYTTTREIGRTGYKCTHVCSQPPSSQFQFIYKHFSQVNLLQNEHIIRVGIDDGAGLPTELPKSD